jgi:hypothetical protein
MSYFNVQVYAPYVATGLINVFRIAIVFILVTLYTLVYGNCTLYDICICNSFKISRINSILFIRNAQRYEQKTVQITVG